MLPANISICSYLVPKCDIVPDLEKIVPPSMAKAVRTEVDGITCVAAAEQSGSVAMRSMKRGQYDKTITETPEAKIARYAAESGIATALLNLENARFKVKGEHSEKGEEDILR